MLGATGASSRTRPSSSGRHPQRDRGPALGDAQPLPRLGVEEARPWRAGFVAAEAWEGLRVAEGSATVALRMAAELDGRVRLEAPVARVDVASAGCTVTLAAGEAPGRGRNRLRAARRAAAGGRGPRRARTPAWRSLHRQRHALAAELVADVPPPRLRRAAGMDGLALRRGPPRARHGRRARWCSAQMPRSRRSGCPCCSPRSMTWRCAPTSSRSCGRSTARTPAPPDPPCSSAPGNGSPDARLRDALAPRPRSWRSGRRTARTRRRSTSAARTSGSRVDMAGARCGPGCARRPPRRFMGAPRLGRGPLRRSGREAAQALTSASRRRSARARGAALCGRTAVCRRRRLVAGRAGRSAGIATPTKPASSTSADDPGQLPRSRGSRAAVAREDEADAHPGHGQRAEQPRRHVVGAPQR